MNEKKFYLQGVETFLMFLVLVCVCSFGLYSNIKSIYNHFIMERNGKHLIGVIKKVSKYDNKKYRIEVSYEIDGETEIGKFYVKKDCQNQSATIFPQNIGLEIKSQSLSVKTIM